MVTSTQRGVAITATMTLDPKRRNLAMSTESIHPIVLQSSRNAPARTDFASRFPAHRDPCWAFPSPARTSSPRLRLRRSRLSRLRPLLPRAQPPPARPVQIVRGGSLTLRSRVDRVEDPARFSLVSQSHPWRHVFDYLTTYDAKGGRFTVPPGKLQGQRGFKDLDAQGSPGRQVQRWQGTQRRRSGL